MGPLPTPHSPRYPPTHHCFSQGTPSWFPSISTPGQFLKKYVASWQDVICEQWVRPSQW